MLQGRGEAGSVGRIPAHEIEALVLSALRATTKDAQLSDGDLVTQHLRRVTIHADEIEVATTADDDLPIRLPWSPTQTRRRREILIPDGGEPNLRPMKVEDRSCILKAIATARAWIEDLTSGRVAGTDAIAARERSDERSVRRTLTLAFLSPTIVQGIIAGRLPRGIGIRHLAELPVAWTEQQAALGF